MHVVALRAKRLPASNEWRTTGCGAYAPSAANLKQPFGLEPCQSLQGWQKEEHAFVILYSRLSGWMALICLDETYQGPHIKAIQPDETLVAVRTTLFVF